MKCDELETEQWLDYGGEPMPCYPAKDVDEAIAELKAENDRLKEALHRLSCNADCCYRVQFKSTKRALWLARAERAVAEQTVDEWSRYKEKHPFGSWREDPFEYWVQAWIYVEKLCRKKAEEYK